LGSAQQSQVNAAFVSLPQLMERIGRKRADILKASSSCAQHLHATLTQPGALCCLSQPACMQAHTPSPYLHTAQMDIEGYEWDVLASLGVGGPNWEESLPMQMAIEFHVGAIYRNSPSYMKSRDFNK
jgi:hypothetical protein